MITKLLENIKTELLANKYVQSCLFYEAARAEIAAPAVFLEVASYGTGSDPATDQLALVASMEARVVMDSTLDHAELSCQALACDIANAIHLKTFGCPVTPAKISGITRDFFKPDFDLYVCYLIEWSHEFHVGESVFEETGAPPHTIIINETDEKGADNERFQ